MTDTAAPPTPGSPDDALVDDRPLDGADAPTPRRWLAGVSVGILVTVFLQRMGEITFLARTDRMVDPVRMFVRNFQLWNPYWDMGSMQYQAVGYLLSFDPVFLAGHFLHIPVWITERAYIAGLMVIGFWGFVRLVDELGIGSRLTRIIGGIAYITSGVVLSHIGEMVVYAMGAVFLPWTVVPLIRASRSGSTRRAAARSGIAIALMGGANAAVVFAVLPVPLLYLLTRERGPRRASLLRWWFVALAAATAWWGASLYYFAAYGSGLLGVTETATATTRTTALFDVLRGSADWLGRLTIYGGILPSSITISMRSVAIIGTTLVVAGGLVGLVLARLKERRFVIATLILGVVAVGAGHSGLFGDPLASTYIKLLDGPLEAFRNVVKFAPLVALPISIGVVHLLSTGYERASRLVPSVPLRRVGMVVLAGLVIFAAAMPLWNDTFLMRKGMHSVPQAWTDAISWLNDNANGRVLLLPGVAQGDYDWGFVQQNPLQLGSDLAFAVRSQGPISGATAISWLDVIERVIARSGDPDLSGYLRRGGISQVVIQSDIDWRRYGAPDIDAVKFALTQSGLVPSASFGPDTYSFDGIHQVEIFSLPGESRVSTYDTASTAWMSGDNESLLRTPASVVDGRAFLVSGETVTGGLDPNAWLVSDTPKATAYDYGAIYSNSSYVADGAGLPKKMFGVPTRRLYERAPDAVTYQLLTGIRSLSASSVGPGPMVTDRPIRQPANIFDGDPFTYWGPSRDGIGTSDDWPAGDSWIDMTFDGSRDVQGTTILLSLGFWFDRTRPIDAVVTTDGGTVRSTLDASSITQLLPVPEGSTEHLRITFPHSDFVNGGDMFGISELALPGPAIRSIMVMPTDRVAQFSAPDASTPTWSMAIDRLDGVDRNGVMHRRFTVPKPATSTVSASAAPVSDRELLDYVDRTPQVSISGSSTFLSDPKFAPRNMFDDDPNSYWLTGASTTEVAGRVSVHLDWNQDRTIDSLRVVPGPGGAMPASVDVRVTNGRFVSSIIHPVDADGRITFDPVTTSSVDLGLLFDAEPAGAPSRPISVADLDINGLQDLRMPRLDVNAPFTVSCDDGLAVDIGGHYIRYSATTSIESTYLNPTIPTRPCDDTTVSLPAGTVDMSTWRSVYPILVEKVLVGAPPLVGGTVPRGRNATIGSWENADRTVDITPGPSNILTMNEVSNRGWEATLGGQRLEPIQVDGWRQGFVVPAGDGGTVTITYAPERPYRFFTIAGLVILAGLLAVALWRPRRRDDRPAIGEGTWSGWIPWVMAIGAAVLTVGPGALLLAPIIWIVRHRRSFGPWIAGLAFAAGGALTVAQKRYDLHLATSTFNDLLALCAMAAFFVVIATFLFPPHDDAPAAASEGT